MSTPKSKVKQKWLSQVLQEHEEELRKQVRVLIYSVQRELDENEVLQELWARVLTHADHYDSQRDVLGWIYGIARNIVREYARRSRQKSIRYVIFSKLTPRKPEATAYVLDQLYHEDPRMREEAGIDVARFLGLLPANQRELLTLYHLDGLSIAELARRYAISEGNIRVRLSRALNRLRTAARHG